MAGVSAMLLGMFIVALYLLKFYLILIRENLFGVKEPGPYK